MEGHTIEYREKPRGQWEEWARFMGTKARAYSSAIGLLVSLKDESRYAKAAVRVDGHMVRGPRTVS